MTLALPAESISPRPMVAGYAKGRVPRELREQQMLDVAEEVFGQYGYDGASIEEICRRAGIKRPLFYSYFGSKEGLYLACYTRARASLDALLAAAVPDADNDLSVTADAVRHINEQVTCGYFAFLAEHPNRWDMLYGPGAALAGDIGDQVALMRDHTVDLLAALLRRYARPNTDEDTILAFAHASSGLAEHLARWARRTGTITPTRLAALASAFSWAGLAQLLPEP